MNGIYHADNVYLNNARNILDNGTQKEDRTGTGTISLFSPQMRFDLSKGFPLLTTKKLSLRIIAEELFWFLKGSTDVGELIHKNVNIWNKDAYRDYLELLRRANLEYVIGISYEDFIDRVKTYGYDLGSIYGKQWRSWENNGVKYDQILQVIDSIKNNPHSRRHIVSAWNAGELGSMALPPCHMMFQFYVSNGKLSCHLYQRSGDFFLGVPYNIASYALLTHMIAKITNLEVGELVHTIGDAHIYLNHVEQIKEQLSRNPKDMPTLKILNIKDNIEDYTLNDIELLNYNPHPIIKGDLSVG